MPINNENINQIINYHQILKNNQFQHDIPKCINILSTSLKLNYNPIVVQHIINLTYLNSYQMVKQFYHQSIEILELGHKQFFDYHFEQNQNNHINQLIDVLPKSLKKNVREFHQTHDTKYINKNLNSSIGAILTWQSYYQINLNAMTYQNIDEYNQLFETFAKTETTVNGISYLIEILEFQHQLMLNLNHWYHINVNKRYNPDYQYLQKIIKYL